MPDQGETLIPDDSTEYLPTTEYKPRKAIDYLNDDDPNSLINKLPSMPKNFLGQSCKTVIEKVKDLPAEWLVMDEYELEDITFAEGRIVKGKAHNPRFKGIILNQLRLKFWREYASAVYHKRPMEYKRIFLGVCSKAYFFRRVVDVPCNLAWLLCPPPQYEVQNEETLITALQRLREYIEYPCITPSGRPDHAHAKTILQIVKHLDQRVHGPIVQRIDQRILKANVTEKQLQEQKDQSRSMTELDREIKELEAKASQAKNVLPAKLVEKYEKELETEDEQEEG